MADEADRLAAALWVTARRDEQAVEAVEDDDLAAEVRDRVRRLARADGVPVRTARMDGTVVVVLLDAQVWTQDAATMREKLTLHPED